MPSSTSALPSNSMADTLESAADIVDPLSVTAEPEPSMTVAELVSSIIAALLEASSVNVEAVFEEQAARASIEADKATKKDFFIRNKGKEKKGGHYTMLNRAAKRKSNQVIDGSLQQRF